MEWRVPCSGFIENIRFDLTVLLSVCLILSSCCLNTGVSARRNVLPSSWKSCSTNAIFDTLYNVAFDRCALACFQKQECQGANYYPLAHACALVNITRGVSTPTPTRRRPCVSIWRFVNCSGCGDEESTENCSGCGDESTENCSGCGDESTENCPDCDDESTQTCSDLLGEEMSIAPTIGECPNGWLLRDRSCYRKTVATETMKGAKVACKAMDTRAHLAYINTQEEQDNLRNTNCGTGMLWIGGFRNSNEDWRWGDDSLVADWGWKPGEPDNRKNEKCMVIRGRRSHMYWRDRACFIAKTGHKIPGLCEIDLM